MALATFQVHLDATIMFHWVYIAMLIVTIIGLLRLCKESQSGEMREVFNKCHRPSSSRRYA